MINHQNTFCIQIGANRSWWTYFDGTRQRPVNLTGKPRAGEKERQILLDENGLQRWRNWQSQAVDGHVYYYQPEKGVQAFNGFWLCRSRPLQSWWPPRYLMATVLQMYGSTGPEICFYPVDEKTKLFKPRQIHSFADGTRIDTSFKDGKSLAPSSTVLKSHKNCLPMSVWWHSRKVMDSNTRVIMP